MQSGREIRCHSCEQDVGELVDLEGDRVERAITDQLIAAHTTRKAPHQKTSAAVAALERLLIAMAGGAGDRPAWAHVYCRMHLRDPAVTKFEEELIAAGWSAAAARVATAGTLATINEQLREAPAPRAWRASIMRTQWGDRLAMTSPGEPLTSAVITPALGKLVEIGGAGATAAVYMRYHILALGGQQWAVPQRHADRLYEWGVRGEAFASPLNSRFVGKPDAVFCSLFPDVDGVFGSVGNFFAQDLGARALSWLVNPPFVESVLRAAAEKVIAALDAPDAPPMTFFFIMAAWEDSDAYQLLDTTDLKKADLRLTKGRYHYEDSEGRDIPTRAASHYFALSNCCEAAEAAQLLSDSRRLEESVARFLS